MSDIESTEVDGRQPNRRATLKGAAWSVPVIAAAVAAPIAAASINNLSLAWTGRTSTLIGLQLVDTEATVGAQVALTRPTQLTVTNGPGAVTGAARVTITVGRPSGLNITAGRARGIGVFSFGGTRSAAAERTAVYQTNPLGGQFGFPLTTFTRQNVPISVASNGTLNLPVVFGLAGTNDLLSVSALATFPVTATVVINGRSLTATSTVVVPVGAGVL